jgi:hypothetical protein
MLRLALLDPTKTGRHLGGTSNLSLVKQHAQHPETFAQEPLQ